MSWILRRPTVLGATATLVLVLGACSQDEPRLAAPKRIHFITIDTLRADHLGVYGYPRPTSPNLDELAGNGILFERAIAQWPKTTPSFASMFTRQYPQSTGMTHRAAKWLSGEYVTLAEMIQSAGFENPFLRDAVDVSDEAVPKPIPSSAKIGENQRLGFYVAQYDANILIADRLIGEILDTAESLGLLEDSLIVFTSDHRERMGEHDAYFRHGTLPYNTGSHVPLFFSFSDEALGYLD